MRWARTVCGTHGCRKKLDTPLTKLLAGRHTHGVTLPASISFKTQA